MTGERDRLGWGTALWGEGVPWLTTPSFQLLSWG